MKQEGSARRRGADKAKPPPGGEQEPPPPPAPQDVEMKEEAAAGSGSTGEADGKAAATEHSQRELDTVTLEGTGARVWDMPRSRVTAATVMRLLPGTSAQPPPTSVPCVRSMGRGSEVPALPLSTPAGDWTCSPGCGLLSSHSLPLLVWGCILVPPSLFLSPSQ
ncbi:26S proteasome non-ATPase regulatory subunit 3 [Cricetulus griseus]|uniref:26S proteasome non-ATPase regulatory subunit 3 n=1 Tax=Cricetulus griseus TaxID=10029 RepID=G3ILI7_CRIGR|nr:26S proteasome non-ATPase regulatory subunit 3 [Cricetulus griseus]